MTKYKCGCESEGIILVTKNSVDLILIDAWSHSVGVQGSCEQCLYCFAEKQKLNLSCSCRYISGKWAK